MTAMPGRWGPPRFWTGGELDAIFNLDYQVLQGGNGEHSKQLAGFEIYAHGREEPLPLMLEQPLALGTSADDYIWTMTDALKTSFTGHWNGGLRLSAQGAAIMVVHEPGPRPFGPAYLPARPADTRDMHNVDRIEIGRQLAELRSSQDAVGCTYPFTQQVEMQLMVDGILHERVMPACVTVTANQSFVDWQPAMDPLLQGWYDCGYQLHPGLRLVKMVSTQPPPAYPPADAVTWHAAAPHRGSSAPRALVAENGTNGHAESAAPAVAKGRAHAPAVAPSVKDALAEIDAVLAECGPACGSPLQGEELQDGNGEAADAHVPVPVCAHDPNNRLQASQPIHEVEPEVIPQPQSQPQPQQQQEQPQSAANLLVILKDLCTLPTGQQARRLLALNDFVEQHPDIRPFLEQLLRDNPEIQIAVRQAIFSAAQAQTSAAPTQAPAPGVPPATIDNIASHQMEPEDVVAIVVPAAVGAKNGVAAQADATDTADTAAGLQEECTQSGAPQQHPASSSAKHNNSDSTLGRILHRQNSGVQATVQAAATEPPVGLAAALAPAWASPSRRGTQAYIRTRARRSVAGGTEQMHVGPQVDDDTDMQPAVDASRALVPAATDVDNRPHNDMGARRGSTRPGADADEMVVDGVGEHGEQPGPGSTQAQPGASHAHRVHVSGPGQPAHAGQADQQTDVKMEGNIDDGDDDEDTDDDAAPSTSHPSASEGSSNPLDLSGPTVPCVPVYVQRGANIAHALWQNAGKMFTGTDKTGQFLLCTDGKGRHRPITRTTITGIKFEQIVGSTAGKYKASVKLDRECIVAGQLFEVGSKLGNVLGAGVQLHRAHAGPQRTDNMQQAAGSKQHTSQAGPSRHTSSSSTQSDSSTDAPTTSPPRSKAGDRAEAPARTLSKAGPSSSGKQQQAVRGSASARKAAPDTSTKPQSKSQSTAAAPTEAAVRSKSAPPTRPKPMGVSSPRERLHGLAAAAAAAGTAASPGKKRVREMEQPTVKEEPVSPVQAAGVAAGKQQGQDTPARKKAKAQAAEAAATLQDLALAVVGMDEAGAPSQHAQQKVKSKSKSKEAQEAEDSAAAEPWRKGLEAARRAHELRKKLQHAPTTSGSPQTKAAKPQVSKQPAACPKAAQKASQGSQQPQPQPQQQQVAKTSQHTKKAAGAEAQRSQQQPNRVASTGAVQPQPAAPSSVAHAAADRLSLLPSLQYTGDRPTMESQMSALSAMRKLLAELGEPQTVGQLLQRYRNHYRASEDNMREFSHHYIAVAIAVESEQRELVLDALRAEWGLNL